MLFRPPSASVAPGRGLGAATVAASRIPLPSILRRGGWVLAAGLALAGCTDPPTSRPSLLPRSLGGAPPSRRRPTVMGCDVDRGRFCHLVRIRVDNSGNNADVQLTREHYTNGLADWSFVMTDGGVVAVGVRGEFRQDAGPGTVAGGAVATVDLVFRDYAVDPQHPETAVTVRFQSAGLGASERPPTREVWIPRVPAKPLPT